MKNEFCVLRRRKNAIRHCSDFGGQVYASGVRSFAKGALAKSTTSVQPQPRVTGVTESACLPLYHSLLLVKIMLKMRSVVRTTDKQSAETPRWSDHGDGH